MTQIVRDVISILEDVKAGEITNQEGLKRLDELRNANRYNLLSGVTGDAEQVLFGPDDMESIDKVIKALKGEFGPRVSNYGWLVLNEARLTENEKKVLELAKKYISEPDTAKKQLPKDVFSKEELVFLQEVERDSKTFPLISGLAQNLLVPKVMSMDDYANDFIVKTVKRFDDEERVSFRIIQQGQLFTVCIM